MQGNEFMYLIDRGVSQDAMELACNRLASALSFSVQLDAVDLALSASIGAAIFPADGGTSAELMKSAGQAKRAAKAHGGGYCFAKKAASSAPLEGEVSPSDDGGHNGATAAAAEPAGPRTDVDAGNRGENRRAEHRNRVFKRGRIILGDGYSTIDCVVRDLTAHGARITVEDNIALPFDFSFSLLDTGAVHAAIRRWQRGRSMGIEFSACTLRQAGDHTQSRTSPLTGAAVRVLSK